MGLVSADADSAHSHSALISFLDMLNKELQVPTMSQFGIDKSQYEALLELMADQALASGSPSNNPRVPQKQALVDLYRQLYQ